MNSPRRTVSEAPLLVRVKWRSPSWEPEVYSRTRYYSRVSAAADKVDQLLAGGMIVDDVASASVEWDAVDLPPSEIDGESVRRALRAIGGRG